MGVTFSVGIPKRVCAAITAGLVCVDVLLAPLMRSADALVGLDLAQSVPVGVRILLRLQIARMMSIACVGDLSLENSHLFHQCAPCRMLRLFERRNGSDALPVRHVFLIEYAVRQSQLTTKGLEF